MRGRRADFKACTILICCAQVVHGHFTRGSHLKIITELRSKLYTTILTKGEENRGKYYIRSNIYITQFMYNLYALQPLPKTASRLLKVA